MGRDGGAKAFGSWMTGHLEAAASRNDTALDEVASHMLEVIRSGGRIHVTGTGHSSALVLETFYRAGGLACINPITHPGLVPLVGGGASTVLERSADLAATLLAQAAPVRGEMAVVFSSSGANLLPVALARGLKDSGVWVVAVSALPHLEAAPARADVKLDEVADVLLDTGVPPGDAAFEVDGMRTAPLSSLTSTFLWNLLLARRAGAAAATGTSLPLWTSANTPGGDDRNAALLAEYRVRVPLL
jgi:uncharacterized phosphosugar-binding protein